MTEDPIFSKDALSKFTGAQSFVNLKETQLFHLVIKLTKRFAVLKARTR